MTSQVYVVGVGLEGLEGLCPQSIELLSSVDLIVGSQRLIDMLQLATVEKWVFGDFSEILERVHQYIIQNASVKVAILATGDPLFFGVGRLILNYIAKDYVTFVPHFSSVQLAFTRLKLPWQDACHVSVHGRDFDVLLQHVRKGHSKISILTDPHHSPAAIAQSIISLDLPIHYQAWVCENLGSVDEQVRCFDLAELLDQTFSSLSVLILIRKLSPDLRLEVSQLPVFGIQDHLFHTFEDRPGLMTKREVRVLALGELALQPQHICWDIGAGTGSMSIEISRLVPQGYVYSLEKTSAGVVLINRNVEQFGIQNLEVRHGGAPEQLEQFPSPDRIFIGGSGNKLESILNLCQQRIAKQGRIVLAIATLENLNQALTWFKKRQWQSKILQAQLAKSLPIAQLTRFNPMNPVYLVTAYPIDEKN